MKKILAVLLIAMLCINFVHAETDSSDYSIKINTASRTLKLYKSGTLLKEFPVAVGKATTKSPTGSFRIVNKVVNPWWNNNGNPVAPGPKNPLGIRWMGISAPRGRYGIHGNSVAASIGTFASGGCIRMYNSDVSELYSIVSIGTSVQIVYENIELKLDKYTNAPVLIVYPNIYKQKTAEVLLKELRATNNTITEQQAANALKLANSNIANATAVCEGTAVLLNNQFVTNDAFLEKDEVYIYYLAAIDYFGLDAETIASLQIKTLEKNSRIYINMTDAASKIGCKIKYDKSNNNINFNGSIIKINGKFLADYNGSFDKEYSFDQTMLQAIEGTVVPVASTKQMVDLKAYTKQKNWSLSSDSLYKIISIDIPLRVKVGDKYLSTEAFNNRYYIKVEDASSIPEIENQILNLYDFNKTKYIDLHELMQIYECKKDSFFTIVEFIKPINNSEDSEADTDMNTNIDIDIDSNNTGQ